MDRCGDPASFEGRYEVAFITIQEKFMVNGMGGLSNYPFKYEDGPFLLPGELL